MYDCFPGTTGYDYVDPRYGLSESAGMSLLGFGIAFGLGWLGWAAASSLGLGTAGKVIGGLAGLFLPYVFNKSVQFKKHRERQRRMRAKWDSMSQQERDELNARRAEVGLNLPPWTRETYMQEGSFDWRPGWWELVPWPQPERDPGKSGRWTRNPDGSWSQA